MKVLAPTRPPTAKPFDERRRGIALGTVAGTIGLGCCVYPATLALVGAASASTAVGLGYHLYENWGWAFKGAGVGFAVAGIAVQRRRANACPADVRPSIARTAAWLAGSAAVTYGLLFAGTTLLGKLAD